MPDVEEEHAAGYLIGLLQEAGLMSSYGMGPFPLSWAELDAWLRVTGLSLSTWEKTTLKGLSEDYVNELLLASDRYHPAPYTPEDTEIDREAIANKVLNFARMFNSNRQKGAAQQP